MTTLHEEADKALEALEVADDYLADCGIPQDRKVRVMIDASIEALKAALAQQGPVGDAEKAKNLLSLTVGCLMRYEEGKHNLPYKAGSATANMVNDVVEYLQDWPKTAPAPQAPQAQQEPDTWTGDGWTWLQALVFLVLISPFLFLIFWSTKW